ncbi:site-specific integrase [Antarcticibacterium flavum]|uniref:Site-specific integrase n=1 Tax=Antarcticibacterium flavum TaxID=2058175 RepID=A0A5B7X315_9FLAO|nr:MULTISPECIES: site-specific integrase [Antarcticibacterium]MCM4159052.1 integrase [Antarcticibacterium sp. W02-3]QCY69455.1 site-specific integrase [Antarcticibacterium flavum]
MRTQSTFSVLFWIYSKRAINNLAVIYARITINGKKLNISLKRKADIHLWDQKKRRVKGTCPKSKDLNQYLDQEYSKLFQCYQELRIEGKILSPENIKSKYFGGFDHLVSLEDLYTYHNENFFSKLKHNTSRLYITSQNYIRRFIKKEYRRSDFYLKELDYSFIIKFENYLRSIRPRHYQTCLQHNAVMKHIQRLRKMVTLAFHLEWIDRDPFVKFKPHLEQKEREFLTVEELQKIEDLEPEIPRLQRVRDLFIFSCYTGISYGDLMLLTPQNVSIGIDKKLWIVTRREKNGNQVKLPLLSNAIIILEKYKNDEDCQVNNSLLPLISNQKLNSYLKEIAITCKIKKNVTFHLARHTFATTVALTNGVPIETVSKILGHRKLSTTQIYAKVIERKVNEDMDILQKKLNGNFAFNETRKEKIW